MDRVVHRALGSRRLRAEFRGPGGHSWAAFGVANPAHAVGLAVAERIGAEIVSIVADEAFYDLACWPDGEFCFEKVQPEENELEKVHADTMGLLMEALRRIDEHKR